MLAAILVLVALLAYANGANDNSKGVATLVGFGAASPRIALAYAMATTAVGAGFSFWFSGGLLKSFSTGLFAAGTAFSHGFFVAVLIGAFGWVILATLTGLPVSTTHAIAGALLGAGLVTFGRSTIGWSVLGKGFFLPLALGPVLSLAAVYLFAGPVAGAVRRNASRCVCVADESAAAPAIVAPGGGGLAEAMPAPGLRAPAIGTQRRLAEAGSTAPRFAVTAGEESECREAGAATLVTGRSAANVAHWSSAGLVGFARGWNDTPKIAALCLLVMPTQMGLTFSLVAVAMALGGWTSGRKVLETLANKLTPLPLPESLTASMTTAALVSLASWNGLPVSTTHVSTGAIVGAGLKSDPQAVRWKKVGEIVLSWIVTLPAAGLIAAGASFVIH